MKDMRRAGRKEISEAELAKGIRNMLSGLEIDEVKVLAAVLFRWGQNEGCQREGVVLDLSNGQRVELRFGGKIPVRDR